MPSRKRLVHLANRAEKVNYANTSSLGYPGSFNQRRYDKRFNKFWNALDKYKGKHVSEDKVTGKLDHWASKDDSARGTIGTRITKEALRKRAKGNA